MGTGTGTGMGMSVWLFAALAVLLFFNLGFLNGWYNFSDSGERRLSM
jgi:hypothetical protein